MKYANLFLSAALLCASILIIFSGQQSQAQSNFNNVVPLTLNNRVAFFDKSDGKLYIYNNDLQSCLSIMQLKNLGDAMEPLLNSDDASSKAKGFKYDNPRGN